MADCTNTAEFLGEWKRMCLTIIRCWECPLVHECMGAYDGNIRVTDKMEVKQIEIVQKWSDDHPLPKPKTYADVFWEAFPNAVKRGEQYGNLPMSCRDYIFGTGCPIHGCASASFEEENQKCADCWKEPFSEQEAQNEQI